MPPEEESDAPAADAPVDDVAESIDVVELDGLVRFFLTTLCLPPHLRARPPARMHACPHLALCVRALTLCLCLLCRRWCSS